MMFWATRDSRGSPDFKPTAKHGGKLPEEWRRQLGPGLLGVCMCTSQLQKILSVDDIGDQDVPSGS